MKQIKYTKTTNRKDGGCKLKGFVGLGNKTDHKTKKPAHMFGVWILSLRMSNVFIPFDNDCAIFQIQLEVRLVSCLWEMSVMWFVFSGSNSTIAPLDVSPYIVLVVMVFQTLPKFLGITRAKDMLKKKKKNW